MGCFSGCLMSSAGIQKLFCGIYSAFKCSFDEFVGEKVVSPSYSSAILGLPPDLSIETLQARREWQDILKVMKENNLQLRLLYPGRISFTYEGEIKSFTDKQKLREFNTTKPALQQMLKDLLSTGNTERVYKLEPQTIK